MSKLLGARRGELMPTHRTTAAWACALLLAVSGCGKKDNSSDTDEATEDLKEAQGAARERRQGLAANEADIERDKRTVETAQKEIAQKQALLTDQREALGSAQATLEAARNAYGTAVAERFAKLDSALATLATRTDAASTDARAGLQARRDQLATKLAGIRTTTDPSWPEYTKDVDTTFDAIERDLQTANR
jgi:DNA repair exonuclease SbcCD ATPase subunit